MRYSILLEALNAFPDRCHCSQFLHICVAFRGPKILAMGYNCSCRVLRQMGDAKSLHAEIDALRKVRSKRSFDILVIRVNKSKTSLLNSQPCIRCENWIRNYPVNKIYFSTNDGNINYIYRSQLVSSFNVVRKHSKHTKPHNYRPISCKAASGFRIPICLSLAS